MCVCDPLHTYPIYILNSVSSYSSHKRSHCSNPALPSPLEVSGVLDNTACVILSPIFNTEILSPRDAMAAAKKLLEAGVSSECAFRIRIYCSIQKLKLGKKNPVKKTGFKRVGETPNDVCHTSTLHTHTYSHTSTLHTHTPTQTQAHSTHTHTQAPPAKKASTVSFSRSPKDPIEQQQQVGS